MTMSEIKETFSILKSFITPEFLVESVNGLIAIKDKECNGCNGDIIVNIKYHTILLYLPKEPIKNFQRRRKTFQETASGGKLIEG
jgi:hypothetical protein